MSDNFETVWSFSTARFTVELAVAPEDEDYRGNCSAIDEATDAEAEAYCAEGGWHWCQTRVQVVFVDRDNPNNWAIPREHVLGVDYLGGCSYENLRAFMAPGGYFRDMVREAVREARGTLDRLCHANREAV